MNSKEIKGLRAISLLDGKRLGKVEHVYLDRGAKRVVGFGVVEHGGLFSLSGESTLVVDADEVHALGPDAMTLDTAAPIHGRQTTDRFGELLPVDQLAHRPVVTENGTSVGGVDSIDFDERSFEVTGLDVSPGLFKTNTRVPAEQIVNIGEDVVLVGDAVSGPVGEEYAARPRGVLAIDGAEGVHSAPRYVIDEVDPVAAPDR